MQKSSHITPKKINPYQACSLLRKQDSYDTALQHERQSEEKTGSNKISINEGPKFNYTKQNEAWLLKKRCWKKLSPNGFAQVFLLMLFPY
jgi:hypothetical protein